MLLGLVAEAERLREQIVRAGERATSETVARELYPAIQCLEGESRLALAGYDVLCVPSHVVTAAHFLGRARAMLKPLPVLAGGAGLRALAKRIDAVIARLSTLIDPFHHDRHDRSQRRGLRWNSSQNDPRLVPLARPIFRPHQPITFGRAGRRIRRGLPGQCPRKQPCKKASSGPGEFPARNNQRSADPSPRRLYRLDEAAHQPSISRKEVTRLVGRGELRSVKVGRRRRHPGLGAR